MSKQYHFISGLPRSGSTLLSAILKQNPKFHASVTDPLAVLVRNTIELAQEGAGMKFEVPVKRRENIVKGLFDGFYADINNPIIFNTNRAWTFLTPTIRYIYPNAKMLLCVRDLNQILNSFEKLHRNNPLSTNTITGTFSGNVYSRAEMLMNSTGIVGFPYIGIKQAITGNEKDMLMIIEYESLTKNTETVIRAIYNFLAEEYYQHDYSNIRMNKKEYDYEIGIDIHTVRSKVEYIQQEFILPPDILQKYANMEVWKL